MNIFIDVKENMVLSYYEQVFIFWIFWIAIQENFYNLIHN